jgi:hypothetical protein
MATLLGVGCGAPKFSGKPVALEVRSARPEVVLITNTKTKEGFKKAIEAWLQTHNYSYVVKSADSPHENEKLTIEYVGHWSWDLALYLSSARIQAFQGGLRVGDVRYEVPNTLDTDKFSNAEERIKLMLDVLFGKTTAAEATDSI